MDAISPVRVGYEEYEVVLAKDQPQYKPLPVLVFDGDDERRMMSRWRLTQEERDKIANGEDLFLQQLTFGHPFQPVCLGFENDFFKDPETNA